jgi:hypothetical protein
VTDLVIAAHDALNAFLTGNGFERRTPDHGSSWTSGDVYVDWFARDAKVTVSVRGIRPVLLTTSTSDPGLVSRVRSAITETGRATHTPKGLR